VRRLGAEQSNTSVLIEDHLILKLYRRVEQGIQPEVEMGRYLTEVAHFANSPAVLGSIEIKQKSGRSAALAVMHAFVRNQGDGWTHTLNYLDRYLDDAALVPPEGLTAEDPAAVHAVYLNQIRQLGVRTAELHRALTPNDGPAAFKPQPTGAADIAAWRKRARNEAKSALAALRRAVRKLPPVAAALARELLDARRGVLDRIGDDIPALDAMKIRTHGDYHLGQVVVAQNDFYIIDFEGEPRRPMSERRSKDSPLRDVAGMLRSFDYAARAAFDQVSQANPDRANDLERLTTVWRDLTAETYLAAYRETIAGCPAYPDDPAAADALLRLFVLEKAFYEIQYELANRPNWVMIPLRGVLNTLSGVK
jgi:maltose alpha-D-glucosyltransferase/alpha-amylase